MSVVLDTHAWVKRLKDAGFTEEQAEAEVGLVSEALTVRLETLATKHDLEKLRTDLDQTRLALKAEIEKLRADLDQIRLALKAEIKEIEVHLDARLKEAESGLDAKLKGLEARIDTKLRDLEARIDVKLKDLEVRIDAKIKDEISKLDVRMIRLEADMVWVKRLAWAILGAAVLQLLKSFSVF